MYLQMSIFDYLKEDNKEELTPGTIVENFGKEMNIADLENSTGKLVVLDMSNIYFKQFKVVEIVRVFHLNEFDWQLAYNDGTSQNGYIRRQNFLDGIRKAYFTE